MFVRHIIQYRCYLFGKLFSGIFIQPSIEVFVFKVAHYLHKVVPSGYHYCCRAFIGWFNSDVFLGPQQKMSLPFLAGKIMVLMILGTTVECMMDVVLNSLNVHVYVSKAGSLLQGDVHFNFLLNCGISSLSPFDSWKNSFNQSLLKNCWISSSNWNRSIFDRFGKMERPFESKSFSSLERGIFKMFTTVL